jgi:hypothetical protein
MQFPNSIQGITETILSKVEGHPEHRMGWRHRREIYEELDVINAHLRRRLAILSTYHVLPIFERYCTQEYFMQYRGGESWVLDKTPRRLLEMADSVLSGLMNAEEAEHIAGDVHYWSYLSDEPKWPVPDIAECVHKAAVSVLGECCTSESPLAYYIWIEEIGNLNADDILADGRVANEETLATYGGDAASHAAMAYACSPSYSWPDFKLDTNRLGEFWTWWLMQAIPTAWALTNS